MAPPLPVILADADNTLWDTDAVFAHAQLAMVETIDRLFDIRRRKDALSYVRAYDQALAMLDHRHLRYPPLLLVKALALGARGVEPTSAARHVITEPQATSVSGDVASAILAEYTRALNDLPSLLPSVREGLSSAKSAGATVWILTENHAERQRARARALGIEPVVEGVTEATKSRELFQRQRRRFSPLPVYVIGDQPDRDITPARAAGCRTVLVPSRFKPMWHTQDVGQSADHMADTFSGAISWILKDAASPAHLATG